MSKPYFIENATLILPGHKSHFKKTSITIKDGRIDSFAKTKPKNAHIIRGKKLFVSPGWHDLRTHLSDPGNEHKDDLTSILNSAAAGGFTSLSTLPNSEPKVDNKSILNYLKDKASNELTSLYPFGCISEKNENLHLAEMFDMHQAGAVGFTDGDVTPSSAMLKKALLYSKSFNAKIISLPMDRELHQEGQVNESENTIHTGLKTSSSLAEFTIVAQQLEIAKYCDAPIHFTGVSCAESVDLIKKAKRSGQQVTCDTTIFNLCFSDKDVLNFDENYKLYPLLRSERDRKALVKAVYEEIIDAVCSNHCPQNVESKQVEFNYADYGALSHQLVLSWYVKHLSNSMDISTFISSVSMKPRAILGLSDVQVAKGEIANLTVFDLESEWMFDKHTNQSSSRNSHEWNQKQKGKVMAVFNNKKVKLY